MTFSRFGHLTYRAGWLVTVVLLLALLTLGCSQTRTVTVPAGQSTISAKAPDTTTATMLPEEPPAPVTRPKEVIVYADIPEYSADLSRLTIDRRDPEDQTVSVRLRQGGRTLQETLPLPTVGEALRGTADSTGLTWGVPGRPQEWTVEGYVRSDPPWWRQVWAQVRLVLAFCGGVVFGYVTTKLVPGL